MTTLGTTAVPASASKKPVIPSQSQVDQANANAHAKAVQIGQTEAQLAAANASLQTLNDQVESLVEAYNGAMAHVQAAQQTVEQAQAALVTARQSTSDAHVQMAIFAADTYRGAGGLDKISALMTADSPASFMSRASTLSALARHNQSVIETVTRTEHEQNAAQQAATQALSDQKAAGVAAAKAKDAAVVALNSQVAKVANITSSQQDLQAQLAVLRGTAKDLATARTQGLQRLAAEAAAAAKAAKAAKEAALAAAAAAAKKKADQLRAIAASGGGSGSSGNGGGGSRSLPQDSGSRPSRSRRRRSVSGTAGPAPVRSGRPLRTPASRTWPAMTAPASRCGRSARPASLSRTSPAPSGTTACTFRATSCSRGIWSSLRPTRMTRARSTMSGSTSATAR
jgi:septal ring factor EnvC (AmiA/AmiB activator)